MKEKEFLDMLNRTVRLMGLSGRYEKAMGEALWGVLRHEEDEDLVEALKLVAQSKERLSLGLIQENLEVVKSARLRRQQMVEDERERAKLKALPPEEAEAVKKKIKQFWENVEKIEKRGIPG